MPRKCCVPNCRGNYDVTEKISVFKFPKDPVKRNKWMSKIPRADFQPTDESVVCVKHFSPQFVITTDTATRPDGSILTVERERPKLSSDAYPSIFPNCPVYLTEQPPSKRKKPEERRQEVEKRDETAFNAWLEADKIAGFSDFSDRFQAHIENTTWLYRLQKDFTTEQPSYWSLYKINDSPNNTKPILVSAVRVFADMHVEVFTENTVQVPDNYLKWLFSQHSPPILTTWSQFDALLSHFSGSSLQDIDIKQQVQLFIEGLHHLCSDERIEESDEDKGSPLKERMLFLVEQLKLLFSPVKRYSCETLLWSFQIFSSNPHTYSTLRNTLLTLPHTSYLRRLASAFSIGSGLKDASVHEEYLKQKCQNMRDGEQNVILMLDEIHVSGQLSYKEGKLEGSASNRLVSEASTAQVFMISSLLSKNKDVLAIIPVKNMNASVLHEMLVKALETLHKCGYLVTCVISDNNRVNRNAFTMMCGGKLQLSIQNPFISSERLFFLFDTVHLFKCIRNNWLAQKDVEKTFLFPSTDSPEDMTLKASFSHLRKLFSQEKSSPLKLAPALNQKSLYPTSTEKQNVRLMLNIFDQRNVVALEHVEKAWQTDTKGTRKFLSVILRLWNILNVKHPYKNIRLRNDDCKSVTSTSEQSIQFIRRVIQWLQDWKMMGLKPREGILSNETMTALEHTLKGMIEVADYLLDQKQFKYVLLGKFQTDNLEFRFSQYRQMSGSNFHVSVQQLLEGEKKLKLMSVLKLISASKGTLSLKDITDPLEEVRNQLTITSEDEYKAFLPMLSECDSIELSCEQVKALVFVTGYVVSKVLPQTDCDVCRNNLMIENKLQVEGTEDCYTYLSALDRGGLTWPSDLAVHMITQIFRIFQILIGKEVNEQQFLLCTGQRKVLMKLSVTHIADLGICHGECEGCGLDCSQLVAKCCKPAVNIFLNNYSKNFSDKTSSGNSARKLKTYTKRV